MTLLSVLTVFFGGLASTLSPCVYPIIPITVGFLGTQATKNSKAPIILFFLGQVLTYVCLGVLAVKLGEVFGFTAESPAIQKTIGVFLVVFGLAAVTNYTPAFFAKINSKVNFRTKSKNLFIPLLVGISSALMASPCSSPILGSVLTTIANKNSIGSGIVLMSVYAFGAAGLFLLLGLGLLKIKQLPKTGNWLTYFHYASGIAILLSGSWFLLRGFDIL
jgi:thiol:disulfide interchange protein DsbD